MTTTEEQYYAVKKECKERVREIRRSVDAMLGGQMTTEKAAEMIADTLSNIDHHAEMIGFAFQEAEMKIDLEMKQMLDGINENAVRKAV
jgi:hypothetical protein